MICLQVELLASDLRGRVYRIYPRACSINVCDYCSITSMITEHIQPNAPSDYLMT